MKGNKIENIKKLPRKVKSVAKSLGLRLDVDDNGTLFVSGSQWAAEKFFKILKRFLEDKAIRFIFATEVQKIRKKIAGDTQVVNYKVPFSGKVKIDRKKGDEWGYLAVNNAIRNSIIEALGFPADFKKPDYDAHISLFNTDEVQQLPKKIDEEGKILSFTIDDISVCDPEGWDEVDELYMAKCSSSDLEELRAKYGFSPKMNENKHEFHITLVIKEKKVAKIVNNIIASDYPELNFPPDREMPDTMSLQEELEKLAKTATNKYSYAINGYGAWITEDGKLIKVMGHQNHRAEAYNYLKNIGFYKSEEEEYENVYDIVNRLGWIRVVWPQNRLTVKYDRKNVSERAKRKLEKIMDENLFQNYSVEVSEPLDFMSSRDSDEAIKWVKRH